LKFKHSQHRREVIRDWVYPEAATTSFTRSVPIIMIHGYGGSTMDENVLVGGYWHYAQDIASRQRETDETKGSLI
jgi:uncharacterized alpha/beta hydrolase family protein